MANSGIAKNIPEIPAAEPPIIIPIIDTKALISTFEFIINGTSRLLSINCTTTFTSKILKIIEVSGVPVREAKSVMTPAIVIPI